MNRIVIVVVGLLTLLLIGESAAQTKRGKVEFSADVMRPVSVSGSDSSAYSLVGNVVFYHNGAVITCDSAVRYSERRMECYRNVIINQDSIYVYGDRADYDGIKNIAQVYSPIIKVKDGDATLYTRKFSFNTLTNIGRFENGGVLRQKANKLESMKGFYYASTHDLVCKERVQMEDSTYRMSCDSIRYNTDSETAYFYDRTRVWNKNGDYLSTDRGSYDTRNGVYHLTKNAYILTAAQELMADTAWYYTEREYAELHNNIQAYDKDNFSYAFGDFATYDKPKGDRLLLTKNPSVAGFEREGADTVFMRADTILLYTEIPIDSLALQTDSVASEMGELSMTDMPETIDTMGVRSVLDSLSIARSVIDSLSAVPADSLPVVDSVSATAIDTTAAAQIDSLSSEVKVLSEEEIRAAEKAAREAEKARIAAEKAEEKAQRKAKRDEARQAAREAKMERRKARMERLRLKRLKVDSLKLDSLRLDSLRLDSLRLDSLRLDSLRLDSLSSVSLVDSTALTVDSTADSVVKPRRLLHGYFGVRVFRKDIQAVCDSVVGYSIDSTIHMFGTPIIWNEGNQITSERVIIYTKNQQLDRAEFLESPIMASEIDTLHYNQITGRQMQVYFRNNDVYRTDVVGNAQTYYYMMDSTDIVGFLVSACSNMTFMIEQRRINTITFREEPTYIIYPMDKIPETQSLLMPSFVWYAERRPTLEQVFDRTIRPQKRKEVERYSKPSFPITSGIDAQRIQLSRQNLWIDRNDEIPVEAMEFLREIGVK